MRWAGWLIAAFLAVTPFLAYLIPATWPQPPVRTMALPTIRISN
jgi:hypothetical protein